MTIKYECHVPVESFGFISAFVEGSAEDAVAAYREIADLVKVQPESDISKAEFGRICTEYLKSGKVPNGGDLAFNAGQKYVLSLITSVVRERNK